MKNIAIPYKDGEIFQHFGKSPAFYIAETENKKIFSAEVFSTDGAGHSALKDFLKSRNVDVVISGGMGAGAYDALSDAGISVIRGQSGSAEAAIMFYMNGDLKDNPEGGVCHHHDGEAHDCGSHSCGSHTCK